MSADRIRDSIESANTPLVYKSGGNLAIAAPEHLFPTVAYRVATRALVGMQKEALIAQSSDDVIWRLVCDEGPYLNGTDLAPPPLAFFSAGMASSIAAAILSYARQHQVDIQDLEVVQDNLYTMEGSAMRGTMIAGALPVQLSVGARAHGGDRELDGIVYEALAKSPVDAMMRNELVDTFSIVHNGDAIAPAIVTASSQPTPDNPARLFSQHRYAADDQQLFDAVCKLEATESVFDTSHGAGAAMKDVQNRQLQIRSRLTVRDDGIRSIDVQIFKPIGSTFRFLSDDSAAFGGLGRAPSGLAYASAGIAFCFMTQLGRYAGIVKKNLDSYGVVQDTVFDTEKGITYPIDTHSYLETTEDVASAQQFIDMGEQTCFLHGACRMSNKTRIKIAAS